MNLSKLAIIGPGLLGGSIAQAFRKKNSRTQIAVWARRDEAVAEIQSAKIADIASTDLRKVIEAADMIVFCVPIGAMTSLAEKIAPHISATAFITDVGSVKAPVVKALAPIFAARGKFVGSHPMAGSEQTGLAAARADLFDEAVCIVTPDESSDAGAVEAIREFWTFLGCHVRTLPPAEHDEVIALVSHLPHLLAATLVNLVCAQNANSLNFCGNGFRDTTRVASGPPEMWNEIFSNNRDALKKSVEAMIEKLRDVLKLLDMDDENRLTRFLKDAKTGRDRLRAGK